MRPRINRFAESFAVLNGREHAPVRSFVGSMRDHWVSRLEEDQRALIARIRKYAGFWAWPDKRRRELGVVEEPLKAMGRRGTQGYQSCDR